MFMVQEGQRNNNSYIVNMESAAEVARLINLHRIVTQGMGGLFPDEPDFRKVHDVLDLMPLLLPKAAEHIQLQKRAEVADVPVVVDRRATHIDTQRLAIGRREIFDSISESVEETDGHPGWGLT